MKIVIIGRNGQLANELIASCPTGVNIHALGRADLNITDLASVRERIAELQPSWIINTAAYTAVDQAESEPEAAAALNELLPHALAAYCADTGCKLIHLSTDFVFNGEQGKPYQTSDKTDPKSVYGQTKLNGEKAVLQTNPDAIVIRTSWVFSSYGNNFVKTMLRLMASRDSLSVVDDQVGSPTSAADLAAFIWLLITNTSDLPAGVLHWTNSGCCSWYDFAVAIEQQGRELGLLSSTTNVNPIPATNYPTPATRPHYSLLNKSSAWEIGGPARHWQAALHDVLEHLKANS